MRKLVAIVFVAFLGSIIAGCGELGLRTVGPAIDGQNGALSERSDQTIFQRPGGAPFVATYKYTGEQQAFVVPYGVTQVTVDVYGAEGWHARGGSIEATIPVTPGESLAILVGGKGTAGEGSFDGGVGGFNGGGNGACGQYDYSECGGGGGGASDIRQGGSGLANRVIVAGGGGGESGENHGGAGGGLIGRQGKGGINGGRLGLGGGGGTQSGGGIGGFGGHSLCDPGDNGLTGNLGVGGPGGAAGGGSPCGYRSTGGGGGGGGYYGGGGGGGGGPSELGGGGGGGSSYIEPSAINVKDVRGGNKAGKVVISW
jgi:hypothetical protein